MCWAPHFLFVCFFVVEKSTILLPSHTSIHCTKFSHVTDYFSSQLMCSCLGSKFTQLTATFDSFSSEKGGRVRNVHLVTTSLTNPQDSGSALIKCGPGSRIFPNFGSGSNFESRVLMTKNWTKLQLKNLNIFFYKNCNLVISMPP